MKKLLIGLSVFGVFLLYSLWVRHELPTLAKPAALISNNTTNSSLSGDGSSSSTTRNTSGTPSSQPSSTKSQYKNGTYTGSVEDAFYGNVQVAAMISGGKITDVTFLQYPDTHDTSVMINQQAMPYLKQEAVHSQSANVQIISGATFTSQAFIQSLTNALSQARA